MHSRVQDLGGKLKEIFLKGMWIIRKKSANVKYVPTEAHGMSVPNCCLLNDDAWCTVFSLSMVGAPGPALSPGLMSPCGRCWQAAWCLAPVQPEPESHIVISSVRPGWASSALASQAGDYWSGRKGDVSAAWSVKCEINKLNIMTFLCQFILRFFCNMYVLE